MSISFNNALGVYESALNLRADRAAVLSTNLANADTPGFKARDIDFQSELKRYMGVEHSSKLAMQANREGHIGFANVEHMPGEKLYRVPLQPSIDGNTVEEQVEHAEFMKNSLEFQAAFTMLNSRFKGLTKAIRGE